MSVEAMAVVLHHSRASGAAKIILLGIANHEGDGGSWPSIETLAKYANINVRNTRIAIRKLQQMGEVRVDVQAGGHAHTPPAERTNRYQILVRCPPECDRTTAHRVPKRAVDNPTVVSAMGASDPRSLATAPVAGDPDPLSPETAEPSLNHPEQPAVHTESTDRASAAAAEARRLLRAAQRKRPG